MRGGDRRRWESFFPETIQNPARFLRPPGGFLREDNPQQLLFSQTWLFLSRRGDHVPRAPRAATHPNTQPRCHSPGGGERPQPPLSGAPVLRGRLTRRAPGPHRDSSCRLGRKCGENRLAPGNNRMARCLRRHPLFRKVLIAPVHPQAGRSTGLWSFKNPLRLRRENCPVLCPGQWVPLGRDYFKRLPASQATSDTGSPARAEVKQVSRKANYVKCKTNTGRKNKGGAGWDVRSSDLRVTQLVTKKGFTLPSTFGNFVGLSRAH